MNSFKGLLLNKGKPMAYNIIHSWQSFFFYFYGRGLPMDWVSIFLIQSRGQQSPRLFLFCRLLENRIYWRLVENFHPAFSGTTSRRMRHIKKGPRHRAHGARDDFTNSSFLFLWPWALSLARLFFYAAMTKGQGQSRETRDRQSFYDSLHYWI